MHFQRIKKTFSWRLPELKANKHSLFRSVNLQTAVSLPPLRTSASLKLDALSLKTRRPSVLSLGGYRGLISCRVCHVGGGTTPSQKDPLVRCHCNYVFGCQKMQQLFSGRKSERWKDLYLQGNDNIICRHYGDYRPGIVSCTLNRTCITSPVRPQLIESKGGRVECCGKGQVRYTLSVSAASRPGVWKRIGSTAALYASRTNFIHHMGKVKLKS